MPDLSQFPLKKGVSLLNSGFTPLGTLVPLSCYFEGLYLAMVSISH